MCSEKVALRTGVGEQLRPEIALSWHRSRLSGLEPDNASIQIGHDAVPRRTRLLTAASPVLNRLSDQLSDAPCCVLISDRDSRIAAHPIGSPALQNRLEGVGAVVGGIFLEETTGTNAIATAYELRHGVVVHGEEHYLEPFKAFSCYGHPILHPATRRLQGVLDITCLSKDSTQLLKPIVAQAVREIELNLLEIGRYSERRLLSEFQVAASGSKRALIGVAADLILANRAATELLTPADHARVSEMAVEMTSRPGKRIAERIETIALASGQSVVARFRVVEPGVDAVLAELEPRPQVDSSGQASRLKSETTMLVEGQPVYVSGSSGTGRTTTAFHLAGARSIVTLDGAEMAEFDWRALSDNLSADRSIVLVAENIHLMSESHVDRLRRMLRPARNCVVLTGCPASQLTGASAALVAICESHVELADLSDRAHELPRLISEMVNDLGAGDRVIFTPAALAALAMQPWPGNLTELRSVVRVTLESRSAGCITPNDLPERYRPGGRHTGTILQRVEYNAIVRVLQACDGNKLRAAEQLGISRTTLYNRIRALRIPQ
ncbi:sigma-54-dependent Fis family transcriptional regulator [Nocardia sp. NPDC001965]